MTAQDLTGMVFNKWTVVERAGHTTNRQTNWLCRCVCGKESTVSRSNLIGGSSKGCRSCRDMSNRVYTLVTDNTPASKAAYRHYSVRSRKKNIPFEITYEAFLELTQQACYYCGQFRSNCVPAQTKHSEPYEYNGLDRFEPEKGYVLGNLVACCKYCNRMKSDMPYLDFIDRVALIAGNHNREGLGLTRR